jgi:glutamate racemase
VIACNTASTLALPALRARFPIPFVGTVPAIKPACERSATKRVSVLATPGTVKRDYTQGLIREFASGCNVTLVGSEKLASLAEAALQGDAVEDEAIAAEIQSCFVDDGSRTDTVVLACTHYPLILDRLVRAAPWPVDWVDPAPAIARRASSLLAERGAPAAGPIEAYFTSGKHPTPTLTKSLRQFNVIAAQTGALTPPV